MTDFPERSLQVLHLDEPKLEFGYGQTSDSPKDGLFLYGPNKAPSRPNISVGVVGTGAGIRMFRTWLTTATGGVKVPARTAREKKFRPHLSDFPGLEEAYGIRIDAGRIITYELNPDMIDASTLIENHHEAVQKTVDMFLDPVLRHGREEERTVDVWVFVTPEVVFERCRPLMGAKRNMDLLPGEFPKRQKVRTDLPLFAGILDQSAESAFDDVPDFHRQIKARLLQEAQTCQLVRETTLAPEQFLNRAGYPKRGTQDRATVAWNLATGLYYKSQEEPPWKVASMREGVCYIGLVFKVLPNHHENHACCAAQMFLSEGDGVVFRGANGPWKTERRDFHLSKTAAKQLIERVLKTYKSKFGSYPKELFIHGKTKFNDEEWEAFSEAAPESTNIVAVRIQPTSGEMKLFRDGDYPCIRGTALILGERDGYLWTTGYVPHIDTYLGPETPNPLFITILRSSGPTPALRDVLRDILSLTKVNFNSASYSDGLPVTIRFADKVGEVLVMGSAQNSDRQPFKYYI